MASLRCWCLGRHVWEARLSWVSPHGLRASLWVLSIRLCEDLAAHHFWLRQSQGAPRFQRMKKLTISSWRKGEVTSQKSMWIGKHCYKHCWKIKSDLTSSRKVTKEKTDLNTRIVDSRLSMIDYLTPNMKVIW